jgi:hypothetical protein
MADKDENAEKDKAARQSLSDLIDERLDAWAERNLPKDNGDGGKDASRGNEKSGAGGNGDGNGAGDGAGVEPTILERILGWV